MSLGFFTIVICIFIAYAEECYETIEKQELGFWIWGWIEEDWLHATFKSTKDWERYRKALKRVNGDWTPAKYVGTINDKIHKFIYTNPNGGIITFEFAYNKGESNPCTQLEAHIKKHQDGVIPVIQLAAKMTHPAIYYEYVQASKAREKQPFLIRPIQKIDNEILFVGKDDPTLPYRIRAGIYGVLNEYFFTHGRLKKTIQHYQHQNVFTTIKILNEDYKGNKKHDEHLKKKYMSQVLSHKGIVIFGYNKYWTEISKELAKKK
eukprot:478072_1